MNNKPVPRSGGIRPGGASLRRPEFAVGPRRRTARQYLYFCSHIMTQRRTDERSALATEYALFLAETRGVNAGVMYLDSCNVPREILLRALREPGTRRSKERRQQRRND